MKLTNEKINLENGLKREWIITNGIGGFASSTVIGANTRKYHGLLIAPLTPPARRYLILSKLDEAIEIENQKYELFTNIGENYISQGYQYLESFEKEYVPVFKYKIQDVEITKAICMEYGRNTVGVYYKIKNGNKPVKLTLAPVINFRDFHCMSTDHIFDVKQIINNRKVKLIIDGKSSFPVYMNTSEGKYIEHNNDTFKDMFYIEEQKRGFYPKENHYVTGVYEIEIQPNEEKEISFACSFEENIEEINVNKVIKNEIERIEKVVKQAEIDENNKFYKDISKLVATADQFIVYRPTFGLHTIIAGYPWFLDWGRDSLISFEGLLLIPKRYDIAREVLLTMVRDIKYGLVPNGYSGYDNRPLYNSSDSSLLLFEAVYKYARYTGDYKFIEKNIYEKLVLIINNYCKGIDLDDNNIFLDIDGLLSAGTENTQNTWMDAKYGNHCFTPRNGKTVELNSLWYNALKILEELSNKFGNKKEAKEYAKKATQCQKAFMEQFYNKKKKCLYDVIGDTKVRPNQLFATALSHPVLEPNSEIAKKMLETVTKKLLNKYGLKTLAKGEKGYVDIYEGDAFRRDSSYHQGITWPWLLGLYYDTLKNMVKTEKDKTSKKELQIKLNEFIENITKTFTKELYERGAIGSIAEIYDSKTPYLPKGTIAQGWSVAEIFRIINRM